MKTKRKAPIKPHKVYLGARIDHELVAWLRQRAIDGDRNVGQELTRILRKAQATEEKEA